MGTLEKGGDLTDRDRISLPLRALSAHSSRANQIAVQILDVEVGQWRADKVILVEDSHMLHKIIKFSQETILHKLSLEEGSFINWTVEESLEANIPEEIVSVLLSKEVFREAARVVSQLLLHHWQRIGLGVRAYQID